jgi:hypothetical protein
MGKSKLSLMVGIALLAAAGVCFMQKRTTPDEAAATAPAASAVEQSSPVSGKSGEPRRNNGPREKKDQYYYPSSGKRTVSDEVRGLLAPDGSLTDRAAIHFGLDEEKRRKVNSLMKSKFDEESRQLAQRAIPLPGPPGDADAGRSWEIHALKDRGRAFWDGMYRDLPALVGASHAEAFVAAMNDREYGGFGRLDGRIQILSKEGEGQVKVEWSDPASGATAGGGIMNFSEFDDRYGTAFRQEHATAFSPESGP